jgi:hypothetical protein
VTIRNSIFSQNGNVNLRRTGSRHLREQRHRVEAAST